MERTLLLTLPEDILKLGDFDRRRELRRGNFPGRELGDPSWQSVDAASPSFLADVPIPRCASAARM